MRKTASIPPSSAHVGGSHACSIQQRPPHIKPIVQSRPNHGCPKSTFPAARTRPSAGKYIDTYVGCMVMWMVSKCGHIAGVGFASLPEAKVSAENKKLKSSAPYGCGIG